MTLPRNAETAHRFAAALLRNPDAALLEVGRQLAHTFWRGFGRGVFVGVVVTLTVFALAR